MVVFHPLLKNPTNQGKLGIFMSPPGPIDGQTPESVGQHTGLNCSKVGRKHQVEVLNGGFRKWWYPTTMGFPTKNDHFGVFWGVPPLKETTKFPLNSTNYPEDFVDSKGLLRTTLPMITL